MNHIIPFIVLGMFSPLAGYWYGWRAAEKHYRGEEPNVIFRARDPLAIEVLAWYRDHLGVREHQTAIDKRIEQFTAYRALRAPRDRSTPL